MAVNKLEIQAFLEMARKHPIVDVRSPAEYAHAHIPGAFSLPLFDDAERKVVGTTYKQMSREQAIKIGLDFFGPKMKQMLTEAEQILQKHNTTTILVHCWRGGMRSAAIAWLLDLYGFKVFTLIGGYKTFRNWALQQFEIQLPFQILGGYTGSGKTEILSALKAKGEIVIDLEELAGHKGSSFGSLGLPEQSSVEHFENKLSLALSKSEEERRNNGKPFIWMEAESQRIGQVNMPNSFFEQLKNASTLFVKISFEKRLDYVCRFYGMFEKDKLMSGIYRVRKRLGGLDTKNAINFLLEENVKESFRILLNYYDRLYDKSTAQNREAVEYMEVSDTDSTINSELILKWIKNRKNEPN